MLARSSCSFSRFVRLHKVCKAKEMMWGGERGGGEDSDVPMFKVFPSPLLGGQQSLEMLNLTKEGSGGIRN